MPSMLSFEIGRSNVHNLVDLLHQDFWSKKLITLYVIYYVMLLLCIGFFVWVNMPITIPYIGECWFTTVSVHQCWASIMMTGSG
jgi:hypothetical protein